MEQNIFQVTNENHLDEILLQHARDLVIIMLSSKDCGPCKTIKPKFVGLSKVHKDVFFIYVDRTNYDVVANKYFADYVYTPTFLFYFGGNRIAFVEGSHEESVVKILGVLKQKIEEKRREVIQKEKLIETQKLQELQNTPLNVPAQTELVQMKIAGLNKLRELVSRGAKLTNSYNLDSDVDDINFEIRFQTDSQFRQYILNGQQTAQQNTQQNTQQAQLATQQATQQPAQASTQSDELLRKQEQVKQIQELDMLNQKMQMQSFQKLQQLKKIKLMKEQQELNK